MDEALVLADQLSKSNLLPVNFKGKPNDILVAMMWSHTLGIPVIQGLQGIAVINGKPAMYGDLLLATVRGSGWLESIEERVDGEGTEAKPYIATCIVKRRGETKPHVSTFSQKDAQTAGLWSKAGPWKQYPKRMLQLRARAFALRDSFPDVLSGMAVAEEERDIVDVEGHEVVEAEAKAAPAPAIEAKPKMPRRKAAPKAAEPVETVVEAPAPEPQPEPQPQPQPEEAAAPEAAPADADNSELIAQADTSDVIEAINRRESYEDLVGLWHTLPPAMKQTAAVVEHFQKRTAELEATPA